MPVMNFPPAIINFFLHADLKLYWKASTNFLKNFYRIGYTVYYLGWENLVRWVFFSGF